MRPILLSLIFLQAFFTAGHAAEAPPAVSLDFDQAITDKGPRQFKSAAFGNEARLVHGKVGQALFVGGSADWVDVGIDNGLDLSKGGTLDLWFKREDWENPYKQGSGWQTVAAMDGMTLNIAAPGCPGHAPWTLEASVQRYEHHLKSKESRAGAKLKSPAGMIRPNVWYHAVIVFDASKQASFLFINDKMIDKARLTQAPTGSRVNPLRLGTWYKKNQAFRGAIDEVKIYDYAKYPGAARRGGNFFTERFKQQEI